MSPTTFDPAALLISTDGDREFLRETVQMLHEDLPAKSADLDVALAAHDAANVKVVAHTMKSMFANFCAHRACELARKLEHDAAESDWSTCQETTTILMAEANRLVQELDEFVQDG
jgi:HPt (histidine-containing phosphotransfer) domain-containing protein